MHLSDLDKTPRSGRMGNQTLSYGEPLLIAKAVYVVHSLLKHSFTDL